MAAEPPVKRRADAERNIARILDRAARLLADDRNAGMVDIAAAAEVGRATLYRHFPTREVLIEAIEARAYEEAERAMAASRLDEDPAPVALERLLRALVEVGDRYRIVAERPPVGPGSPRQPRAESLARPLFALFARGREDGAFRADLSERWELMVFHGVLQVAIRSVAEQGLTQDEAAAAAATTLLDGLGPRAR